MKGGGDTHKNYVNFNCVKTYPICTLNYFVVENIVKKFWSKKICQTILVKKICQKKLLLKKFGSKNFWVRNIFGQRIFWFKKFLD